MQIIDIDELMDYLEGDLKLLQGAYEIFCEICQGVQTELQSAVSARDVERVHRAAHKIKGMLSNFQAHAACETAQEIELISDPEELAETQPLLDKLSSQIDAVQSEVSLILQNGAAGPE